MPHKGFIQLESLQHNDYTNSLIKEMNLCEAGTVMARAYELEK